MWKTNFYFESWIYQSYILNNGAKSRVDLRCADWLSEDEQEPDQNLKHLHVNLSLLTFLRILKNILWTSQFRYLVLSLVTSHLAVIRNLSDTKELDWCYFDVLWLKGGSFEKRVWGRGWSQKCCVDYCRSKIRDHWDVVWVLEDRRGVDTVGRTFGYMTFNLLWIILNFNFRHNFRAKTVPSDSPPFLKANLHFADLSEVVFPIFVLTCRNLISIPKILIRIYIL